MKRTLFTPQHEEFRDMIRNFVAKEIVPEYHGVGRGGRAAPEVFRRLGEIGVMGMNMPEKWGGSEQDYTYNVVLQEETARAGVVVGPLRTHLDVVLPYFRRYADRPPAAALVSRDLRRGADDVDRAHRARHRLGPRGRAHRRRPRRGPLRPQRREDLYHRRIASPTW